MGHVEMEVNGPASAAAAAAAAANAVQWSRQLVVNLGSYLVAMQCPAGRTLEDVAAALR